MPDEPFDIAVEQLLGSLSGEEKDRILKRLIWEAFGEVDEDGTDVLIPGRRPDRYELRRLANRLQEDLWPSDDDDKGE